MKVRSIWFGLLALLGVLYVGVFGGFSDLTIFFNVHALALVFGGTIAITLVSYSFAMISEVLDFLIYGFFLKKTSFEVNILFDLLVSIYKNRSPFFDPQKKKYDHALIRDGIILLRRENFTADDLYDALSIRTEKFRLRYQSHAKVLLNLSKYPPALGLLGASTGMIQMMMNLGTGGPEAIGKAMAIALTATFWGIGVANFVFLPLSDYAFQLAEDDHQIRELITEVITKEKEGVRFESLIEIVSFKLDIAQLDLFKKSIHEFLLNEKDNETIDSKNTEDLKDVS